MTEDEKAFVDVHAKEAEERKRKLAQEICKLTWVVPYSTHSETKRLMQNSEEELKRIAAYWRDQ